MGAASRRDPARQRHWRTVLEEQRRSGLTIEAFCQSREVASSSFYSWKRELSKRTIERRPAERVREAVSNQTATSSPRFLPVQIEEPAQCMPSQAAAMLELVLPSGEVLRVATGFDPNTLAQVLGVLRGPRTC
jgi:hypothetical protein